jgi:IstB-like ATP binding protein
VRRSSSAPVRRSEPLIEARDDKRLLRLQRQLAGYRLLIIDELGYVPLSPTGAELLFEVISQRYERGSIIVTSNLPFDEVGRNQRPAGLGTCYARRADALALPIDEGFGRHHRQCAAPVEPTAEQYQGHLCRTGSSAGFDFAFLVES